MVLEELLAPAGSYDVLVVAVNAGADAVYIAGQQYGARAYAKNFTMEEIEKAVNYAHMNGSKVHVTVNTLVNNFEIVDVLKYLFKLYQIGVDAVIVQDFGLIWLLKTFIPDLEVHASTQMGLNNYSSFKWASRNNIKRVVLPREVNIHQIKQTHDQLEKDNIDMDIEVFGHGALCYCVSGKCYMSSYNSGRSGNRGACAQPCRREYRLKYRGYNIGNGYLLSTHDLATYNHLTEISDAGVKSLKLEGRMKSKDYIGTIVNSYRNIIDGNPGDYKKDLHLVFNRQFTDGYMMGDKPGEVMGRGHSGHEGLYIGDIVDIDGTKVTIEVKNHEIPVILEPGDGIAFKYNGKIKGIYLENIIKQDENEIIIDTTRLVKVGTEVFISYSKSTHEYLKQFEKETIKSNVPVNLSLTWDENLNLFTKVEFHVDDELINFRHKTLDKFEKAKNKPLTEETLEKQLSKTGGTPFYMDNIRFNNMPKDIFIPIREINQIRREILDTATEMLMNHYTPTKKAVKQVRKDLTKFFEDYEGNAGKIKKKTPKLSIFIDDLAQIRAASGFDLKRIYFDGNCHYNNSEDYYANIKETLKQGSLMASPTEFVWVLSSFISEEDAVRCNEIVKELENEGIIISVMGDFPGMSEIFDCPIYGNHNLNVWNSFCVRDMNEAGFKSLILSSELSGAEIKELVSKNHDRNIDLEMIVNGNLEVIVSKDDFTNLNDGNDFIISNDADYAILEDKKRKKFKYKVFFDYNRQSHIINKDCLCLIEEMNEIKEFGLDNLIVDCRYSNEQYTSQILSIYNESLQNKDDEELTKYKYQIMDFSQSYINKGNFIEGRLHENS
ncbi:MAG: U32 family peptidase [Methanobrevibacter thaueri]|jgi:putative protease|uniref:U32 family peptidase n=1 Tax=Methanobrevibacter thaueri TaxID=190975 RepID=UPI0026ED0E85|nr:U32 family peptidase [Methanobrevibacter thaueri]MBE6495310.1 U32 family peptidase [Methanobrevibacter thaueri]